MCRFIITLKFILALSILFLLVKNSLLNFQLLTALFCQPVYLFFIFLLLFLNVILSACRWHRLNISQKIPIDFSMTFIATYIGLTFNYLLPGSLGGDVVRASYLFKSLPQNKIACTFSVLVDRGFGLLGVFFTLILLGMIYKNDFERLHYLNLLLKFGKYVNNYLLTSILISIVFGIIFLILLAKLNFIKNRIKHLMRLLVFSKKTSFQVFLECFALSLLIQLLLGFITYVIAQALGFYTLSFTHSLISNLVVQIVSIIPISPGGIGLAEMIFAKTILQLNPNNIEAYATIYVTFRLLFMIFSAPGILLFLRDQKHQSKNDAGLNEVSIIL